MSSGRQGPSGICDSKAFLLLFGQAAGHVGVNETGRHAVDGDVATPSSRASARVMPPHPPWRQRSWPARVAAGPTTEVMLMMRP